MARESCKNNETAKYSLGLKKSMCPEVLLLYIYSERKVMLSIRSFYRSW